MMVYTGIDLKLHGLAVAESDVPTFFVERGPQNAIKDICVCRQQSPLC